MMLVSERLVDCAEVFLIRAQTDSMSKGTTKNARSTLSTPLSSGELTLREGVNR